MSIETEARNTDLARLAELLKKQHDVKLDAVVPAQAIQCQGGNLSVAGLGSVDQLDASAIPDTVEELFNGRPGIFEPTNGFIGDVATTLGIPVKYLRSIQADRPKLFDATVNSFIHGGIAETGGPDQSPDGRNFLFRAFRDPEGGPGMARALLSDSYRRIDHLDMLLGTLEAIHEAGVKVEVKSADLSENRMVVRMVCPEVKVVAEELLQGYRNPFLGENAGAIGRWRPIAAREGMGYDDGTEPVVHAGFKFSNSETGGGACMLVPEATVLVCRNGLTITADMMRQVHLGSTQEPGIIRWSAQTEQLNLELIKSRTKDAVGTWLNVEYLQTVIDRITEKAVAVLTDPAKTVEVVAQKLNYTEEEQSKLLSLFIAGGQTTAGGIMQAASALAQCVESPERAMEIEAGAIDALELAFAAA